MLHAVLDSYAMTCLNLNMKKLHLTTLCAILALSAAAQNKAVRIASVSPLSGAQASLGEMIKLGAQLAIESRQDDFSRLGLRVEISPQDDQASPDVGVAVAKRLVNDRDVIAVVGHLNSGVAIPASEVYKDHNLVMVSPANTNPRITDRKYLCVNRVCGRDDIQGPIAAEFAVTELKAGNIFVINDKTAYGQGVAEAFRKRAQELGARIVAFIGTEERANFQPLILQMKAQKPDLVYFGGIYDQGGVLIKQMREKGITAAFLGPDALDSSEFVKIAQETSKGAYYTTVAGPVEKYPAAAEFVKRFQERFGKKPESYALYSYDAAGVILEALAKFLRDNGKPPGREELCHAVRAVKWEGITGTIEFDSKGDRKKSDYHVMLIREPVYPGTLIKTITASPPEP